MVCLCFSLMSFLYNVVLSLLRGSKALLPGYFASMIVQARTHLGLEQKNAQHLKLKNRLQHSLYNPLMGDRS